MAASYRRQKGTTLVGHSTVYEQLYSVDPPGGQFPLPDVQEAAADPPASGTTHYC